ncbi:MAG: nucleotidyltransferase domain-containing protein [Bacteroidales bacterium]|nr:nucleotidyltransferase domain-containing protein [Candidatus Minthousia equi]MDO4957365.1 nucleotidyltransferase domain-containing protein [Bacteroidales bacterium]
MSENMYNKLRAYLSTQPIDKAWVFGSFSRGEETPESDIDILVQFTPGAVVGLFKYARIVRELTELLHRDVDLVEDGTLLPFAVKNVENDKILIYEREAA